ncbi:uncharacterized protein LOC118437848 [Folsomia candida]|nr:uncharacterized protein LOC118437848 [Folsomia candida]XP_035713130.1 uncharacterized protein LOC118437848 [Folsomia candida]
MELFPNLQHLKTDCKTFGALSEFGMLQGLPPSFNSFAVEGGLDATPLECLLKIPSGLKKLSLSRIFFKNDKLQLKEVPIVLYKLLKKQSPSLEICSVSLGGDMEKLSWRFPAFPVMTILKIYNSGIFRNVQFESSLGSGIFGRIDYQMSFPVLEILHFSTYLNRFSSVAAFLPSKGSGCPTVKEVDIDFLVVPFRDEDMPIASI